MNINISCFCDINDDPCHSIMSHLAIQFTDITSIDNINLNPFAHTHTRYSRITSCDFRIKIQKKNIFNKLFFLLLSFFYRTFVIVEIKENFCCLVLYFVVFIRKNPPPSQYDFPRSTRCLEK